MTTYTGVSQWWDGTAMEDIKVDQYGTFTKYKPTGEYLRENLPNWGENFFEVDSVIELRSLAPYFQHLLWIGYYKGVRLSGYRIKGDTPSPIDYRLSSTSIPDNGGSVIEVGLLKLVHDFIGSLNIKYFGANSTLSDNRLYIQNAFDYAQGKGLEVVIPKDEGDYLVSDAVAIGSKTTVSFLGSYIKAKNYTTIGTIIYNKPNSEDIIINNPLVDADNIIAGGTGENGISMQKVRNVRIYGGVIKNCKKGIEAYKLGGKALQFESVDIEDVIVDGTRIENCSWAMSTQYDIQGNVDEGNTKVEVSFNNIYAINCVNLAILHQMNGLVDSDRHIVNLTNITSVDCGNEDGLIVVSRLRNAKINGLSVVGSNSVNSIIRGRHNQCEFKNIKVLQDMPSLIDNRPSFHGESTNASINNNYEFKLDSDIGQVLTTSSDSTYSNRELKDSNVIVNTSRDDFDFCSLQSAWPTTNINIISPTKTILVNTTEAVAQNRNTPSAYNQSISIGTGRKVKSGMGAPNGNVLGDVGDIYLQEVNGYANVYFKYFGGSTNTGWNHLMPALSGTADLRPPAIQAPIGAIFWNVTNKRIEVNDGANWLDIFAPATTTIYGMVKQAEATPSFDATDVPGLVNQLNAFLVKYKASGQGAS